MPPRVPSARPMSECVDRDSEAIAQLAADVLPALIARLGESGLAEIELRHGQWRARLRKPAGASGHAPSQTKPAHEKTPRVAGGAPSAGPESAAESEPAEPAEPTAILATSPAVGIYHPVRELAPGMLVKAGDRLGTVDVLGVHQDVTAPCDGIVSLSLAEPGEAVEYGQELVRIQPPVAPSAPCDQGRGEA